MLSPNGRSFMWDVAADGYTRGEGFSAIFLKTLSQAIADGDHIECIVRETGVNSDGKTPGLSTKPPSFCLRHAEQQQVSRCQAPSRRHDLSGTPTPGVGSTQLVNPTAHNTLRPTERAHRRVTVSKILNRCTPFLVTRPNVYISYRGPGHPKRFLS